MTKGASLDRLRRVEAHDDKSMDPNDYFTDEDWRCWHAMADLMKRPEGASMAELVTETQRNSKALQFVLARMPGHYRFEYLKNRGRRTYRYVDRDEGGQS